MEIKKCILTNNECYSRQHLKVKPQGIVVHSTGANNPNLKRYVQPDDGLLGKNTYNNDWNRPGILKCVHAFIGKDKNGAVQVYQTLPYDYACWGCGSGKKGSYNHNPAYIQFEICEDNLTNEDYFNKCFDLAAEYCAYLIKEYNLSIDNVISHHESYLRGYGTNHGDCDHWLKKFGKDMNWFREEVKKKMNNSSSSDAKPKKEKYTTGYYTVISPRYIRTEPSMSGRIKKVKECTAAMKSALVNQAANADAQIKAGKNITALQIITESNGRVWLKNYSGYVCIEGRDGDIFLKKMN